MSVLVFASYFAAGGVFVSGTFLAASRASLTIFSASAFASARAFSASATIALALSSASAPGAPLR